jgi:integrase
VKAAKGDKAQMVQVPADAVAVLRRRVSDLERDDLVFSTSPAVAAKNHRKAASRRYTATSSERSNGAGVPLSVVSRQLGHADIHTTMRYAHHAPELTPGIFDRLADGGDHLSDDQFLDDSSKSHPREIEKARNREISGP